MVSILLLYHCCAVAFNILICFAYKLLKPYFSLFWILFGAWNAAPSFLSPCLVQTLIPRRYRHFDRHTIYLHLLRGCQAGW